MPRQSPVPDDVDRTFWEAANEGRLVVQHCGRCDRWQYPPTTTCPACGASDLFQWRDVDGRGSVYSFAVIRDTQVAAMRDDLPFNAAVISLDECPGVLMLSRLPGSRPAEVELESPVRLVFESTPATGQAVPEWELAR